MFMLSSFLRKMLPPMRGTISRCLPTTFSPLPSTPLPSPREAHVWYIKPEEIDGSSSLKQYMNLLSSCEKRDVSSLNGERLQMNAILARTLVRTTLSRYFDGRVDPRSIKFKKGIYGKPEIMWQDGDSIIKQPLQFSLSHTSSLIACAIALDTPIGIDVEENKRKPVNSVMSVARRYFTTSEVEYLAAIQNPDIQQKEFIKLWTLKTDKWNLKQKQDHQLRATFHFVIWRERCRRIFQEKQCTESQVAEEIKSEMGNWFQHG